MMLTAAAVANEFFTLQEGTPGATPIDNMKLQKLLYYAHSWHLAIKDGPLFEDDIEAWPWGPVVRNIYIEFKRFKASPIQGTRAKIIIKEGNNILDWRVITPYVSNQDQKQFIREVWETHKDYSGIQLSNATHFPGEPWAIVKEARGGILDDKPKIENDLIKSIFKAKLENASGTPSAT